MSELREALKIEIHEDCDEVWAAKVELVLNISYRFTWFIKGENKYTQQVFSDWVGYKEFKQMLEDFAYYVKDWEEVSYIPEIGVGLIRGWKKPFRLQRLPEW